MHEEITYEYVPQLGRSVYLKYTVIEKIQVRFPGYTRPMICGVYSFSDTIEGPYDELWWTPFGFDDAGTVAGVSG